MLGEPDRSVAEPIGELHLLDRLVKQTAHELVVATVLRREFVDQADIHRDSLPRLADAIR
ncbi:MAG: hypothetical protein ACYDD7_17995 [Acidimicrobiales bacterium]